MQRACSSALPPLPPAGQAAFTVFGFTVAIALLWWAAQPTEARRPRPA